MGNIKKFLKGNVRIYITDALDVAQKSIKAQKTKPLGTLVLGTAVATFSTLHAMFEKQKIIVQINGDGAHKLILFEVNKNGKVRNIINNPDVPTDADKDNFNAIPLIIGIGQKGTLKVTRTNKDSTFGGEVNLFKSDIVSDLAFYFSKSEQINTAVISDVILDTPNKFKRAVSVIFQMLPNHTEEDILWVERFIKKNKLSKLSLEEYIAKLGAKLIDEKIIKWKCSCSLKQMKELLEVIPPEEQKNIIEKHGKLEIKCNYCNKTYKLKEN